MDKKEIISYLSATVVDKVTDIRRLCTSGDNARAKNAIKDAIEILTDLKSKL